MKRIVAIDILRGFALLGILLMNIMGFAMPDAAYSNPNVYGGQSFINHLIYGVLHVLADQKFMAIFSMLFGASIMLLSSKSRAQGRAAAAIHYIRNIWLLIFGLIHFFFIWSGDILTIYALCAFVLYFFRTAPARVQLILGLVIFLLPSGVNLFISSQLAGLDAVSLASLEAQVSPSKEMIARDLEIFRGPYSGQLAYRLGDSDSDLTYTEGDAFALLAFFAEAFGRSFGMMLIGMALYSLGILTASRSRRFYKRMLFIGLVIGIPATSFGLYQFYAHDWEASYSLFLGRIPNHIATPFTAGAYTALIMLWSKSRFAHDLQTRLAAVGRMALSNYIGQSLVATFIFYGFGYGLYGSLDRTRLIFVVLGIWSLQLLVSPLWLSRFRYGPLEWLWRSLTYRRLERLRK